jgi:hypothetical protein
LYTKTVLLTENFVTARIHAVDVLGRMDSFAA